MRSLDPGVLNQDFFEFLESLKAQAVEAILVGGYAVVAHGYHRTTGDLDVWVNPTEENYRRLIRAFSFFGLPAEAIPLESFLATDTMDVFTFGIPPSAIDILTKVKGLSFDECYQNSETILIGELEFNLLHLNDLRTAKRSAGRNKDLDDLEHL